MREKHFEFKDIHVHYVEQGEGVPVIFVHCSSATHKEWKVFFADFLPHYRLFAPDLVAYGKTGDCSTFDSFDQSIDVQLLQKLIELVGQPVHLVGHSYGGVICLEVARKIPHQIISLCLIEPVAFPILRKSKYQKEWQEAFVLANSVMQAVEQGEIRRAARIYMKYWIGWWRWQWMPQRQKDAILATMEKVAKEFYMISHGQREISEFNGIQCPVTLIYGNKTKQPTKAIIRLLQEVLPNPMVHSIKGAGHMSPFTHTQQVYLLILQHFSTLNKIQGHHHEA